MHTVHDDCGCGPCSQFVANRRYWFQAEVGGGLGIESVCCELRRVRHVSHLVRQMTAKILHKTIEKSAGAGGLDFVLSDETPDRMNDVILSAGWDWRDFSTNPIALFNHDSNFPIGKWSDLRIDKQKRALIGRLQLAPEGTSDRIDELRALVAAGILKAVSVGFRPIEARPREDKDGGLCLFARRSWKRRWWRSQQIPLRSPSRSG
jgi:HK97 family phage prohead protease